MIEIGEIMHKFALLRFCGRHPRFFPDMCKLTHSPLRSIFAIAVRASHLCYAIAVRFTVYCVIVSVLVQLLPDTAA